MNRGNSFRKLQRLGLCCAMLVWLSGPTDAEAEIVATTKKSEKVSSLISIASNSRVSRGRHLFQQDFRDYEGFQAGSDGLGPMYNEVSCVACHHQVGEGGGGSLRHNVDILTLTPRTLLQVSEQRLVQVHSGFRDPSGQFVPSIVLHQYSTDPRYAESRKELLGKRWTQIEDDDGKLTKMLDRRAQRSLRPCDDVYIIHSQRNTPALFGSGLIDLIPDELLHEQAQREKKFNVGGRVSQLAGDQLGKFGWRAQLPSLKTFVLSACANELGLEVAGHSQTRNPHLPGQRLSRPEVSEEDTDAMIEYVSLLDAPAVDCSSEEYKRVVNGLRTFEDVGCAECHVRHLGPAKNIYSDLLLHDMGAELSDPLGASPEIETITSPNLEGTGTRSFFEAPRAVNVYYVGTILTRDVTTVPNTEDPFTDVVQQFAETSIDPRQEWRTPPLWGCADSAPYMHDGRAATLDDAIAQHGGQANLVRLRFMRLPKEKRDDVLLFLSRLRAPGANNYTTVLTANSTK